MVELTPLTPSQTIDAEKSAANDAWLMRFLVSLDEMGNVLIGGVPDETISTHAALLAQKHSFIGEQVCRLLNQFQSDHGAKATAGDLIRVEDEEARLKASGLVPEVPPNV